MSFFKSFKMLFTGDNTQINPNDLKKFSPEELEEMVSTKREMLIKEHRLKDKQNKINKGLVGMKNLGNTCFMNSALQCLSNTWPLTEYLINNDWEETLNTVSTASEGRLICEYYILLQKIWIENNNAVNPNDVKKAIMRVSKTFAGFSQQDTQEFLSYFLDAIHEDINQIFIKPYIQQKDYAGEPIHEFAKEAWMNHLLRNKSFIVDIFHGQYFSKILCPTCKHESVTCDPFDMLSLNLPAKEQVKFEGYFVSYTYDKDTYSVSFIVNGMTTLDEILDKIVKDWNKQISDDENKLEIANLIPYFYLRSKIVDRIKKPYNKIRAKEIMQSDNIFFVLEGYSKIYTSLVFESNDDSTIRQELKNSTLVHKISIQVQSKGKSIAIEKEVVVPKTLTSYQLYLLCYIIHRKSFLNAEVKNSEFIKLGMNKHEIEEEFRKFFPEDKIDPKSVIFTLSINLSKILSLKQTDFVFEKFKDNKLEVILSINNDYFAAEPKLKSCKKLYIDNLISKTRSLSIYDCFEQFVNEEKLDEENMWYCSVCKSHKEAYKKMAIMKYPKILIIHLKRFKKDHYKHYVNFNKNSDLVDFPIDKLDISKYVIDGKDNNIQYSLYAIANHYGSCGGGHYTAFCKNEQDQNWYCYDDSSVNFVKEQEIITEAAYVLFYKLKVK